jgi:hypothetical protein
VQNLDLSGTALDHVPTHFFDRLGIPTVSQFSARALKPRTNVGASIGANETGDRTSTGGGVGATGFQSVGFDAFYSSATAAVPAIDFGVGSTTSTTCETYARAGRSHARGSHVVRIGTGPLRLDFSLLLFVCRPLLSCFAECWHVREGVTLPVFLMHVVRAVDYAAYGRPCFCTFSVMLLCSCALL